MKEIVFTTPAFYASGQPHVGHLYAVLLGQILTHYHRLNDYNVFFQSGMDEHGEKIESKAKHHQQSPSDFVEQIHQDWQQFYQTIHVQFDEFIRTSRDPKHHQFVQDILTHCYEQGDIYLSQHTGHYYIECEAYLNNDQINSDHTCLIHRIPTEERTEENYYFRLSRYQTIIADQLNSGAFQIYPDRYRAELLGLIKQEIGDFSISRPKTRTSWGIELPSDPNHVTYVWFDALPNYLSAHLKHKNLQFDDAKNISIWSQTHHIIGKDILKFHGLYWPAMLLSCGFNIPKLIVTGWILVDDHKISKSLGNLVDFDFFGERSLDALISYLFSKPIGDDLHFSEVELKQHYETALANQIGNLHSRILGMMIQYTNGQIPSHPQHEHKLDQMIELYHRSFQTFQIHHAINAIYQIGRSLDGYLSQTTPWLLWKDGQLDQVQAILQHACAGLSSIHQLLKPFWPITAAQMQQELINKDGRWIASPTTAIFPRLNTLKTPKGHR